MNIEDDCRCSRLIIRHDCASPSDAVQCAPWIGTVNPFLTFCHHVAFLSVSDLFIYLCHEAVIIEGRNTHYSLEVRVGVHQTATLGLGTAKISLW
jgi:hypothetical protein